VLPSVGINPLQWAWAVPVSLLAVGAIAAAWWRRTPARSAIAGKEGSHA